MGVLWENKTGSKTVTVRITNALFRDNIDYVLFVTVITNGYILTRQIQGTNITASITYVYEYTFEADAVIDFSIKKLGTVPLRDLTVFSIIVGTGTGKDFFPNSNIGIFYTNNNNESLTLTNVTGTIPIEKLLTTRQTATVIGGTYASFTGAAQGFDHVKRIRGTITATGAIANVELIVYENDNTGNGFVVGLETFTTTGAETIKFLLAEDIQTTIRATSILSGHMGAISFKDLAYSKILLRNHGGVCTLSSVTVDGVPLLFNTGI